MNAVWVGGGGVQAGGWKRRSVAVCLPGDADALLSLLDRLRTRVSALAD